MATYTECPKEVLSIAQELIALHHPFLSACNIGFVMRDEAGASGGKTVPAHTTKVPDKIRPHLTQELDILIVIAEDQYSGLSTDQRTALIDHELCHITVSKSGWTTCAHDIEEFREIIERHGLWNEDLFNASTTLARSVGQLPLFTVERNTTGVLISAAPRDADKVEQE